MFMQIPDVSRLRSMRPGSTHWITHYQLTKSWPAFARLVLLIFLSSKPMDSNSYHHLKEGSHGWQLWKAWVGLVCWYMLHLLIFKMNELNHFLCVESIIRRKPKTGPARQVRLSTLGLDFLIIQIYRNWIFSWVESIIIRKPKTGPTWALQVKLVHTASVFSCRPKPTDIHSFHSSFQNL